MRFLISVFLIVYLTPVSAQSFGYSWLFRELPQKGADVAALRPVVDLKTKFVELGLRKNLISEQTILEEGAKIRDGWIQRVGVERARQEFFRDVVAEYAKQVLTGDQFAALIDRPGFQQERLALIAQLQSIEMLSGELMYRWNKELGHSPSWLTGNGRTISQILQDKHRPGFSYLLKYELAFDDREEALVFTHPGVSTLEGLVLPMAPELTWNRVLSSWLYTNRGTYRNQGERDVFNKAFAATLENQSVETSERLKFYHLLKQITVSPELYHDAAFAKAQLAKFGAQGIAMFNAYLDHTQLEEAQNVARLAQERDLSGAAAHHLTLALCNRELAN